MTAALLALREHRLNQIVFQYQGLGGRVSPKVLLLLQAYQRSQLEATRTYAQAVYLRNLLKDKQRQFKQLIKKAEKGEAGRQTLNQAAIVEQDISQIVKLLGKLNNVEGEE